ncbi:MAG: hypothetical protein R3F61_16155 [Myxococcota bacterium]
MRALPVAILLAAAGCRDWPAYSGAFDVPSAIGVLQPELGGPYEEPVGFVGNAHGGQIVPLALKQGRFLTDDPTVSFLRTNQVATGQRRLLSGIAPSVQGDTVTVFATDRTFGHLLEIPFVTGLDASGAPEEPASSVSEARFVPTQGSAITGFLEGLEIKTGWVSTEDWVVEYVGAEAGWTVIGSRSGRMEDNAFRDKPYVGVRRVVAFTLTTSGEPMPGDRFEFSTDNGLVEHDADGIPLEMRPAPDGSVVAVVVQDSLEDRPVLKMLDPLNPGAFPTATPVLPPEASPTRLAWNADGTRLFASDATRRQFWSVDWPSGRATRYVTPWPTADVAPLSGNFGELVYLVPVEQKELWVYDLATRDFRDTNTWVPGVQGLAFSSPVIGIEAMHLPYLQLAESDAEVRYFRKSVAVSQASGAIVFAEEDTGCLVTDGLGPRTEVSGSFGTVGDYQRSFESDFPLGATLRTNAHNSRHVLANPCGGITRAQGWVLRYDELVQAWRVRGDLSGMQEGLAYEDQRYVSDDGEVSFLILSGGTPSQDGWVMTFRVVEGLTSARGDNDGDASTREVVLDHPGDPVYFHYRVGPDDQGWRPVDDRPFVLVAGEGSDRVGRVMPQEGLIDASWE